jgi:hypothetical protein
VKNPKLVGIVYGILVILATIALIILSENKKPPETKVATTKYLKIADVQIQVEIASTKPEIELGLSNRPFLDQDKGLYFLLGERREAEFWMKNMQFPIDIIWVDSGKVVGFVEKAPIPTGNNIPIFKSPQPITNVLEVNAGFVEKNSIKEGDLVIYED